MRSSLQAVGLGLCLGTACTSAQPQQASPEGSSEPSVVVEAEPKPEPASWTGQAPFKEPEINLLVDESGVVEIEVKVDAVRGVHAPRGPVPFTSEPFILNTRARDVVEEADILGTGLALDLDGDGKVTSSFPTQCVDGVATVGNARIAPLAESDPGPRIYDPSKIVSMSSGGARALMYAPCGDANVSVGIGKPGEPIEILESPGPLVQVLVLEAVAGPHDSPKSKLEIDHGPLGGLPPRLFVDHDFEGFGEDPRWYAVQWSMVPLDPNAESQTIRAKLVGHTDASRIVVAAVELSNTRGVRIRDVNAAEEIAPD